jgi:hypothetical protein
MRYDDVMLAYLRIAVTALSLSACVLLVALWARSYWWDDRLILRYALSVDLQSRAGQQLINLYSQRWEIYNLPQTQPDPRRIWHWTLTSRPARNRDFPATYFRWYGGESGLEVDVPHWCLILISGAVAAAPWIKSQFSLRTLLIATTLAAVALGLVVVTR